VTVVPRHLPHVIPQLTLGNSTRPRQPTVSDARDDAPGSVSRARDLDQLEVRVHAALAIAADIDVRAVDVELVASDQGRPDVVVVFDQRSDDVAVANTGCGPAFREPSP